jgi:hypothetical protein
LFLKSLLSNLPTAGDALGLFAQYKGMTEPMKNTLRNRAGDTPNINAFEDFGKDALETLNEAKGFLRTSKEEAEQDLNLAGSSQRMRNRNSARSVNTSRALDLATEAQINENKGKLTSTFANQMSQLFGQEAQLENMQDQAVMQGEQNRDMNDRRDRDNFYSQLGVDLANKFQTMQGLANNLNSMKKRGDNAEMIDKLIEISKNSNSVGEFLQGWLKLINGQVEIDTKGAK